jgi:acetyl-CoA C-acetyltransferase
MIDPRTPVLAGVGQCEQRLPPNEAASPIDLFARAAREADADAGGGLLARADTVATVAIVSWPYPDPSRLAAQALGIEPRHTVVSTTGGNSPQMLLNELAARIQRGECDVALVGGAETIHTRWRARREPRTDIGWPVDDGPACRDVIGIEEPGTDQWEMAHQLVAPTNVYPLFETALRAEAGRTVAEHQQAVGALWSRFAEVSAGNPHAWSRQAFTADEIATASPDNRMVVFPYTKRMCANIDVDQGAAVLLCSYEAARAAGVADDRLVFLHAGADAHDHWWVSTRASLARSVAIGVIVRAALDACGLGIDDIARFDLYSCFPSAVQMAMQSIGIAGPLGGDARPLTVTGGLGFAGGPVNNYPTHAVAAMAEQLRADPGSVGLTTALGWYVTKHSVGVWSTRPPERGYARVDVSSTQSAVDAQPARVAAGAYSGSVDVEATAVVMQRDGSPASAVLAGLAPDGRRVLAITDEPDAMLSMTEKPWEGTRVSVRTDDTNNVLVDQAG